MGDSLDMSLDDLIRKNSKPGSVYNRNANFRAKDRVSGSGPGPDRRFLNRLSARTTPYPPPVPANVVLGGGESKAEGGTKLYISNLDYGVSNEDLEILFSDVGEVIQHSLHYDRNGRSKGTAEVVFLRYADAIAAIKRYNNLQLDGKPLKIELVGISVAAPPVLPPTGDGILGKPDIAFRSEYGYGHGKMDFKGLIHGNNGSGRGRARGPQQGKIRNEKKVTAEDLDAELEKYRLEAIKLN